MVGGRGDERHILIYCPTSDTWREQGLLRPLLHYVLTAVHGILYAIGDRLTTFEAFDISSGECQRLQYDLPSLQQERVGGALVARGNELIVSGGGYLQ